MRLAGRERDGQRLARREQVALADHVVDRLRTQPLGERRQVVGIACEEVVQAARSRLLRQIMRGRVGFARHCCNIRRHDMIRNAAAKGTLVLVLGTLALTASAFDVEGHRGTRGHAPENTLAAFKRALGIGVTTLETDLAVTRDGVLVISHDPSLNPDLVRAPDGRWLPAGGPPINTLTLAELKRYDIGRIDPCEQLRAAVPRAAAGRRRALPDVGGGVRPGEGAAQPGAPQHRDQARPGARRRDRRSRRRSRAWSSRPCVPRASPTASPCSRSTGARSSTVKKLAPEIATACLTIQTNDNDNVDGRRRRTLAVDSRDSTCATSRLGAAPRARSRLRDLVAACAQR